MNTDISGLDSAEYACTEDLFHLIAEQALVGMVLLQDDSVKYVNQAVSDMTGYTTEEIKQWRTSDFVTLVHPEDILFVADQAKKKQALNGSSISIDYQYRAVTKDGSIKWINHYMKTISYNGRLADFIMMIDITQRKNTENSLRESEAKYSTLVEKAADGIMIVQDNIIKFMNKAITDISGYSVQEAVGKKVSDFVIPDDMTAIDKLYLQLRTEHEDFFGAPPICHQGRIICKDGSIKFFETTGAYFIYEGRRAILAFVRDITKRKYSEEALRESEELYSTLIEQSSDGIVIIQDEKVIFANKALREINGYTLEEIKGLNYLSLLLPEYVPQITEGYSQMLEGKRNIQFYDVKIRCKDGSVKDIEVNGSFVKYKGKNSIIVNVRDVTERNRTEEEKNKLQEQLRQSQKMEAIGRLAGGVAHDFNNLLTAITGYSDLILMDLQENTPIESEVKEIKKAADRAASLTRQLLTFSRRQPFNPRVLDINLLIVNMEKMLRRLIGEDIELKTVLEPRLVYVKVDPGQMEQVILNLIVNARDAMPEGGSLQICTQNLEVNEKLLSINKDARPGEFVCISIKDSGTGIDKDTIDKIFDPFFSTKGMTEGTGLGLSVVYGIVKQHEGWIDVESKPGHGSVFRICLPSYQMASTAEEVVHTPLSELQGNGERILLVEDEDVVRDFALRVLTENGYNVREAATAADAAKIFLDEKFNFRLAVIDVVLPDKSGIYLVDELLTVKPEIDVLLCSGYTENRSHWSAIKNRGLQFLQKPYSIVELLKAIKDLLSEDNK